MAGWWTRYFSTIFKGPTAIAWKERIEARRLVSAAKHADKLIYETLEREIEQDHKVTHGLKDIDKAKHELKIAIHEAGMLALNSTFSDHLILKAVHKLVESWEESVVLIEELRKQHKKAEVTFKGGANLDAKLNEVARLFAQYMIKGIKDAEEKQRADYQNVMVIIEEAHHENKTVFMANIRERFKTIDSQTLLARVALRMDIRREKKFLNLLVKVEEELDSVLGKLKMLIKDTTKASVKKRPNIEYDYVRIIDTYHSLIKRARLSIQRVFGTAHLIKKRDFLIMLTVVINAETLKQLNQKWVKAVLVPSDIINKTNTELDEIQVKLEEDLHVLAQGLRIAITDEQKIEKRLTREASK